MKDDTIPGYIIRRKGTKKLYIKFRDKLISTGLDDTPENEIQVKKNLRKLYEEYLMQKQNIVLRNIEPEQKMIDPVFVEYLKNCIRRGIAERTMKGYDLAYRTIIQFNFPLEKHLILEAVEMFLDRRKELSNASLRVYLKAFQNFLSYCIENEYLPPFSVVKKYAIDVPEKEIIPYELDEIKKILEYIEPRDKEFALLIKFLCHTGSRIREGIRLKWSDINYKDNYIKFPNKIKRSKFDNFPISDILSEILSQLRTIAENRYIPAKREKLFRWEESSISEITRNFAKVEIKLEIKKPGRAFHGFRRTFASYLSESGMTEIEIHRLMRHRDFNTTNKYYIKQNMQKLKAKLDLIEL
jgi:integrase/recombinase XerD